MQPAESEALLNIADVARVLRVQQVVEAGDGGSSTYFVFQPMPVTPDCHAIVYLLPGS